MLVWAPAAQLIKASTATVDLGTTVFPFLHDTIPLRNAGVVDRTDRRGDSSASLLIALGVGRQQQQQQQPYYFCRWSGLRSV